MAVDGDNAVGVLVDHRSPGIHAEGTHQILILGGLIDDLALIDLVRDVLEHVGGQLHADAQIHAVGVRFDTKVGTDGFHPLAAAAAHGDDTVRRFVFLALVRFDREAALRLYNGGDGGIEEEGHSFLQLFIEIGQHLKVDVCAEMAHRRVEQMQIVLQAQRLQGAAGRGIELGPAAAMLGVDLVHIAHQLKRLILTDVLIQRSAEGVGDVVLAVGKRARAAETVHNRAGRTVDAAGNLFPVDGTFAGIELSAALKHGNLQVGSQPAKLIRRENTAGAGADEDHIVILHAFITSLIVLIWQNPVNFTHTNIMISHFFLRHKHNIFNFFTVTAATFQ